MVGPANLTPGHPMLPLPPAAPDGLPGQKGGQSKTSKTSPTEQPKKSKTEQPKISKTEQQGWFLFSSESCWILILLTCWVGVDVLINSPNFKPKCLCRRWRCRVIIIWWCFKWRGRGFSKPGSCPWTAEKGRDTWTWAGCPSIFNMHKDDVPLSELTWPSLKLLLSSEKKYYPLVLDTLSAGTHRPRTCLAKRLTSLDKSAERLNTEKEKDLSNLQCRTPPFSIHIQLAN